MPVRAAGNAHWAGSRLGGGAAGCPAHRRTDQSQDDQRESRCQRPSGCRSARRYSPAGAVRAGRQTKEICASAATLTAAGRSVRCAAADMASGKSALKCQRRSRAETEIAPAIRHWAKKTSSVPTSRTESSTARHHRTGLKRSTKPSMQRSGSPPAPLRPARRQSRPRKGVTQKRSSRM